MGRLIRHCDSENDTGLRIGKEIMKKQRRKAEVQVSLWVVRCFFNLLSPVVDLYVLKVFKLTNNISRNGVVFRKN